MKTMLLCILLTTPLCASVPGDGSALSQRAYDLSALKLRHDPGDWSCPLAPQPDRLSPYFDGVGSGETVDVAQVLGLIQEVFSTELSQPGADLWSASENLLFARASDDFHQKLGQFLGQLAETTLSAQELLVDFVDLPAGDNSAPTSALMTEKLAADWLAAHSAGHKSYRLNLQTGRRARADDRRTLHLMTDYDVEIAQGSVAFDPIVRELRLGTCLDVSAVAFEQGLALNLVLRQQEASGALQTYAVNAPGLTRTEKDGALWLPGPPQLEHQPITTRSVALDAWLPAGQALVLRTDLGEARRAIVLRRGAGSLSLGRELQVGQSIVLLVPSASLELPSMGPAEGFLSTLNDREDGSQGQSVALYYGQGQNTYDWLQQALEGSPVSFHGPWLLAVAEGQRSMAEVTLARQLALRSGQPQAGPELVLRLTRGNASLSELHLPLRWGGSFAAVIGHQDTRLVDFDVEVANNASIADPDVLGQLDGLALHGRLVGGSGLGAVLELNARALIDRGAPRGLELALEKGQTIQLADQDGLDLRERLSLAEGQPRRWTLGQGGSLTLGVELR